MSNFNNAVLEYNQLENDVEKKLPDKYLGISQQGHNNMNSFNVYKSFEGQDFLQTGIAYVFFTKPSLHFGDNLPTYISKIPIYSYLTEDNFFRTCPFIDEIVNRKSLMYEDILRGLRGGKGFVHFITNLAQNFETQDVVTETFSASDTFKGYKLTLPSSNIETQVGGSFSINYNETRNMEVTVFHKIWADYIQAVRRGSIVPSDDAIKRFNKSNIKSRGYIDYLNSVYYFLLDADGKTIKYYAKYTGVFPTNVPFNSFNWELGTNSLRKVNISYTYNFKEDMNPEILKEFNYVAGTSDKNKIALMGIDEFNTKVYVKNQTVENAWKKKVKVVTRTETNGEVQDYLIFEGGL